MNDAVGGNFDRWSELDALFTRVLEIAPDERDTFLDSACAGDPELRRELDRVLAAHGAAGDFLEDPDAWLGMPEPTPQTGPFDVARVRPALADRYAIQREVGSGGMASVFLAEDLKHRRPVAIKVLRLDDFVLKGSDRFVREIAIAANLHHPHILSLYDSGEADGLLFYVMPYVEGESLHDRLVREGQLPIDDAVHIAREVADALSYAHSRGVVHRDIKPANILLASGHALVADFGVAKAIDIVADDHVTKAGVVVGTPAYMSPEHASGAQELDGRSDIYSMGCVLYEMLTGERPHASTSLEALFGAKGTTPPPRVRAIRDTVPEAIDEVVSRALAIAPADRFATAAQFRDALAGQAAEPSVGTPVRRPRRRRFTALIVAVTAMAAIGVGFFLWSRPAVPFDERDWVVVTDFDNRTNDSVFDLSLHTAFVAGLQQSRYVNVFPRTRVAETLRRMQRESVERIDESTGLEIALRENLRLVVVPSIDAVDSTYVLTIRIVDPATSVDLQSRSERALGKADVLPAVERLVRRFRRDLGEARFALTEPAEWFSPVTTSSLEALRAWTDGDRHWRTLRFQEAIAQWHRAVELDSGFAQAHQSLGGAYYFTGQRPLADFHFDKALSVLDSLSERERLWIRATIASWREDRDVAIRDYNVLLGQYPGFLAAWFNLGNNYMRLGRHEDAIRTFERALDIDSASANSLINIATSYSGVGSYDSALVHYRKAFDLQPEWMVVRNLNHEFGFVHAKRGEMQTAEAVFSQMLSLSPAQQAHGLRSLGLLRMLEGKYEAALDHLNQAVTISRSQGWALVEYRNLLYRVSVNRARGAGESIERDLAAATAIGRQTFIAPGWLQYLARFRALRGERDEVAWLLDSMTVRVDSTNRTDRAAVTLIRGELAWLDGERGEALEAFEQAHAMMGNAYYAEALAQRYEAAGRIDDAIDMYRRIVDDEALPFGWEAQEPWVWAHYRLGQLYERAEDADAALEYYMRLLQLWEDADEDLRTLEDVRKRVRQLNENRR